MSFRIEYSHAALIEWSEDTSLVQSCVPKAAHRQKKTKH